MRTFIKFILKLEMEYPSYLCNRISREFENLTDHNMMSPISIDTAMLILNKNFRYEILTNEIKIGRGGHHIWITRIPENIRIAIITWEQNEITCKPISREISLSKSYHPKSYAFAMRTLTHVGRLDVYDRFSTLGIDELDFAFDKLETMKSHEILKCGGCASCTLKDEEVNIYSRKKDAGGWNV